MGDVLVVRHGTTAENTQSLLRGWDQVPLTQEGVRKVELSARKLVGAPIQLIFTSDLRRAVESAEIVQFYTRAQVKKVPLLRAWNVGQMTGQPREKFKRLLLYYEQHPHEAVPGGESFMDFSNRVGQAAALVMEFAARHPGLTVLVAHNSVLTLLWEATRGEKLTVHEERTGENQIVQPGGMVRFTRGAQGWTPQIIQVGTSGRLR